MHIRHPYGIVQKSVRYVRVEIKKEFWDGGNRLRAPDTQVTVKAMRTHDVGKNEHEQGSRDVTWEQKRHKALKNNTS